MARPLFRTTPVLLAVCIAAACSSGSPDFGNTPDDAGSADTNDAGSVDAGPVDGGDGADGGTHLDPPDPAYWGFADKDCFRYDDGSKQNTFTLAIIKDSVAVSGITTFHLAFRHNGFGQRDEWLEVKGDGLALWRRTEAGDPFATPPVSPTYSIFSSPAPNYMTKAMPSQVPQISKTSARTTKGSTNEQVATTVTVTKTADEQVEALGEQQSASKIILMVTRDDDASGTTDRFWFVPNMGIVKYQLDGMGQAVTLTKLDQNVAPSNCTP